MENSRKITNREWTIAELAADPTFPFNSYTAVRRLITDDKLKAVKYGNKKIRILQSEIDLFFKKTIKK